MTELIYALRIRFFGPQISHDDLTLMRTRADVEGWSEVLYWVEQIKSRKKRAWWLYYLREELIIIQPQPSPYDDDDPFEIDI